VVETSSPVHSDVRLLLTCRPPRRQLAELKQAIEHGAVLPHIDWQEELDVVVAVVLCHLLLQTYVNLHFSVQSVVQEQVVSHPDAMRLHRMALSIVIVPNVTYRNHTDQLSVKPNHHLCPVDAMKGRSFKISSSGDLLRKVFKCRQMHG
uniref:Uncharacterized protein n=1 Tax=Cyprinodon variegatus TaxID=28743 RepID=A0A3Q2DQH1_CYPVA